MKVSKCPICHTMGFQTTQYKAEGGFCAKCNIWVVPYSSRYGIFNSQLCKPDLPIQFHTNGYPEMSWKEWYAWEQKVIKAKLDKEESILFYQNLAKKSKIIKQKNSRVVSGVLRHIVFKKYNYRCVECGATKEETTLEIDHTIPWSKGGRTELENLQVLCKTCNRSKHARIWDDEP